MSNIPQGPTIPPNEGFDSVEITNDLIVGGNIYTINIVTNGEDINEDLELSAKGTGSVAILSTDTTKGSIKLWNYENTNYTKIQNGNPTSDHILTLPNNGGNNGQVIITDGNGNLSFSNDLNNMNTTGKFFISSPYYSLPVFKFSIGDGGNPVPYVLSNDDIYWGLIRTSNTPSVRTIVLPTNFNDPLGLLNNGNYFMFWIQPVGNVSINLTTVGSNMVFDNQIVPGPTLGMSLQTTGQFMVTSPAPGIYLINVMSISPYY